MFVDDDIFRKISSIRSRSPVIDLHRSDKVVIVSDLHMGDGSYNDDFRGTSSIFHGAFEKFYLDKGFKLILNGDIEEMMKFRLHRIMERWDPLYDLFGRFQDGPGIFKLFGNHDYDLLFNRAHDRIHEQFEAVRMRYLDGELFFLHGHQASHWLERFHMMNTMLFKAIVNPLHLKNFTLKLDNKPVTRKENLMSSFAIQNKVLTFMGHTHRPLFGSHDGVPGLFNSGAAIGKRGITTMEIENGYLSLVHWWNRSQVKRYLERDWFDPMRLKGTDIYRVVLDRAKVSEIFQTYGMI